MIRRLLATSWESLCSPLWGSLDWCATPATVLICSDTSLSLQRLVEGKQCSATEACLILSAASQGQGHPSPALLQPWPEAQGASRLSVFQQAGRLSLPTRCLGCSPGESPAARGHVTEQCRPAVTNELIFFSSNGNGTQGYH